MADVEDQDDEAVLTDIADQPEIADSVAPKVRHTPAQRLAEPAGILGVSSIVL